MASRTGRPSDRTERGFRRRETDKTHTVGDPEPPSRSRPDGSGRRPRRSRHRQCRDRAPASSGIAAITRSCPLYRSRASRRATVSKTRFPARPQAVRSSARAGSPGVNRSPTVFGTTTTRSGGSIGPGEHGGARMARDAQHQIGHFDREASQPRRRRPDLDPVRLDDQPGASEAGDCRRERREMDMAAEYDVGPLLDRRGNGADRVEELAAARWRLYHPLGQADRRAGIAGQDRHRGEYRGKRPARRKNRGCIARSRRFRRTRR